MRVPSLLPYSFSDSLAKAARLLRRSRQVVVFTGAGISAESGIPTFRDAGGLWEAFPPNQFATPEGLAEVAMASPRRLADFLTAAFGPLLAARPNPGHLAIAALEKRVNVTVITQNIDNLHTAAGSSNVHEVHGSLFRRMSDTGKVLGPISTESLAEMVAKLQDTKDVSFARLARALRPLWGITRRGSYRPTIVLFGEPLAEPDWTLARNAATTCDCFLSVGTSGEVMPAAMLPSVARSAGAPVIGINPKRGDSSVFLQGPAGTVLPNLLEAAFGESPLV